MNNQFKKVLIVDDEPKIIEVVKSFLESKGFTVFVAENGRQALDIIDRENIALIVLDLMLPDMTGEAMCIQIRKNPGCRLLCLLQKLRNRTCLKG